MTLVDVKHAWFDESVFPSLNPSFDLSPHSSLPDFSGISALPFDSDHEDDITPEDDLPMASPLPSLHPSNDEYLNIELPSDNEAPPSPPPETQCSGPQSLILRLGPHPTQVSSSINASNVLARQQRSLLFLLNPATTFKRWLPATTFSGRTLS
ncbi:hypothetical protein PCANC_09416 [Puccinia coronata f. sp. avenae]|uniref:Uncharacterized protein n=1 Tax=Puccinia coronata f. sp. avenae TaxID=200324 RepID=A0A2N5UU45_9BASI|nr:hypothetical protein PCASD_10117 [Puccinia coronata f. sp. avenae]PLW47973.1 hypothetical protein PCANC_09416 [Puccinia coronata f. sp. avenae]